MILIREATIKDQAQVFDLLRQLMTSVNAESPINKPSGAKTFREVIEEEKGAVLLAEENGQMLGLITLSYTVAIRCGGIYSCIEEFIVTESARGKGVGSKLLEAAIKKATEKGSYELQVIRPSELGYPLYLRYGFEDLGKHLSFHPGRQPA